MFICRSCGTCCQWPGYVLLSEKDIEDLARFLKISKAQFIAGHTRLASNRAQLSLVEKENGECIFLNAPTCRVYDARPQQCRDFPALWSTGNSCPGFSGAT